MNKKYIISLSTNILLSILLIIFIITIIIVGYYYGELIKENSILCELVGTFLGMFFALIFDRLIDKFKLLKKYKQWVELLKKELQPLKNINKNSKINFGCLHNLVNSYDITLFLKEEDLLTNLYNLNIALENFEIRKNEKGYTDTIKEKINKILDYFN